MSRPIQEQAWHQVIGKSISRMHARRAQHPQATLRAMAERTRYVVGTDSYARPSGPEVAAQLTDLETCADSMQYAHVQAENWLIASGTIETASTLVAERAWHVLGRIARTAQCGLP
jgi:hypothetical protein